MNCYPFGCSTAFDKTCDHESGKKQKDHPKGLTRLERNLLSKKIHLSPKMEVQGLFPHQQRQVDIYHPYFLGRRDMGCDITFVTPQAPTLLASSVESCDNVRM